MSSEIPIHISPKSLKEWLENESMRKAIIDVREQSEIDFAPFPYNVIHLPLSKFNQWIDVLNKKIPMNNNIVVICHSGIRSWEFGSWLIQNGFIDKVYNLQGGIDAWSIEIDSRVKRY
tara:strand:+ start:2774 stop:3127 length:354 start_codon:yes stop_codon:yes gene_type:complete